MEIADGSGSALGSSVITTDFNVRQFSTEWIGVTGADWFSAASWGSGLVPGFADDVLINIPRGVTVNFSNGSDTVEQLLIGGGGNFGLHAALTVSPTNAGGGILENYAAILVTGNLTLQSGDNATGISGASSFNSGAIAAQQGGAVHINGAMTNTGTVEADGRGGGGNPSFVYFDAAVNNSGLIEAIHGGGVHFGHIVQPLSGVFKADDGGAIELNGVTLVGAGGTLSTTAGGIVYTVGDNVFDGTTLAVNDAATVTVESGTTLTLRGTLNNTGGILSVIGGGNVAELLVDPVGATLAGGGQVKLFSATIAGVSGAATLTNVDNTISGSGDIGNGQMALVNETMGVIDSNGIVDGITMTGGSMTLDTGANTIVNQGLIEAAGGGLTIASPMTNSGEILAKQRSVVHINGAMTNTGTVEADGLNGGNGVVDIAAVVSNAGVIRADGNAAIELDGATLVGAGGTLLSTAGGFAFTVGHNVFDGTAMAVNDAATVTVESGTTLTLRGTLNNTGGILSVIGGGNVAELLVDPVGATLAGGGQVKLFSATIAGVSGAATLTNVDNTISGSGDIGNGQMALVNETMGVIDSNGIVDGITMTGGSMTLDTGANTIVNQGLIEAAGGGLTIASPMTNSGEILAKQRSVVHINGAMTNTGTVEADGLNGGNGVVDIAAVVSNAGVIRADGNAAIELDGATLVGAGGTLLSTAGGFAFTVGHNVFDGTAMAVNDAATVTVESGTTLTLRGTLNNAGGILSVIGGGNVTELLVDPVGATLVGGGQVKLFSATIAGISGAATLTNMDNTISGSGDIGNGQMTLINQTKGVINNSGVNGGPLTIDTGTSTIINQGLIEATTSGQVTLASTVSGTGRLRIDNGATLELGGGGSVDQSIDFLGSTGILKLDNSVNMASQISGFSSSDLIDFADINFVDSNQATFSGTTAGGELRVSDGIHTATLALLGQYLASTFVSSSDGHGGTLVVDPAHGFWIHPPLVSTVHV